MIAFLVLAVVAAFLYGAFGLYLAARLPASTPRSAVTVRRPSGVEVGCLAGVVLLALAVRLPDLTRGLSFDELFTDLNFVSVDSVRETVLGYRLFNNHIAYSVLAYYSQGLLGHSEWALRLPALVLGLLGVVCLWLFGRGLGGPRVGVASALALALSPEHVAWSVSARGYSGLILFTLLSSWAYLRLLKGQRGLGPFVLAGVLGAYCHLYAVLVTGVQLLFLLLLAVGEGRAAAATGPPLSSRAFLRLWWAFAGTALLSFLCYSPVLRPLVFFIRERGRGELQAAFPLRVLEELSGSHAPPAVAVASVLALVGLAALRKIHPREAAYLLALLLIPLACVWMSRPFDMYPRFFVYYLPYFCLLLVAGCRALWRAGEKLRPVWRRAGLRGISAGLAALVAGAWAAGLWEGPPEEGYRPAGRFLQDGARESTVLIAIGGNPELLQYYCRKQLLVPRTEAVFRRVLEKYPDLRCIYYQGPWEPPEHTKIADFLRRRASTSRSFGPITVFIVTPEEGPASASPLPGARAGP